MARSSVVHMIVGRSISRPGELRWYVRHVWWAGPGQGARDRVLASGEFEAPVGDRSALTNTIRALEAALEEMRGYEATGQ